MYFFHEFGVGINVFDGGVPAFGTVEVTTDTQLVGNGERGVVDAVRVGGGAGFDGFFELFPAAGHDLEGADGDVVFGIAVDAALVGVCDGVESRSGTVDTPFSPISEPWVNPWLLNTDPSAASVGHPRVQPSWDILLAAYA